MGTHVSERLINNPPHFRNPPFDDVAEELVVDVVVLLRDRALRAFLEFVLPESGECVREGPGSAHRGMYAHAGDAAYTLTRRSFASTAMILLSSLACKPIRPARSSSLRLEGGRWFESQQARVRVG